MTQRLFLFCLFAVRTRGCMSRSFPTPFLPLCPVPACCGAVHNPTLCTHSPKQQPGGARGGTKAHAKRRIYTHAPPDPPRAPRPPGRHRRPNDSFPRPNHHAPARAPLSAPPRRRGLCLPRSAHPWPLASDGRRRPPCVNGGSSPSSSCRRALDRNTDLNPPSYYRHRHSGFYSTEPPASPCSRPVRSQPRGSWGPTTTRRLTRSR